MTPVLHLALLSVTGVSVVLAMASSADEMMAPDDLSRSTPVWHLLCDFCTESTYFYVAGFNHDSIEFSRSARPLCPSKSKGDARKGNNSPLQATVSGLDDMLYKSLDWMASLVRDALFSCINRTPQAMRWRRKQKRLSEREMAGGSHFGTKTEYLLSW